MPCTAPPPKACATASPASTRSVSAPSPTALKEVVKFIYDNIQYAEFNTKSDYCQCCGYDGEIMINDDFQWECPVCHNTDQSKMNVTRRTCGYLGENYWNVGKTKEIKSRVLHL